MTPLGDKVVVQRLVEPTTTPGGLILPDNAQQKSQRATVLFVGEGRYENGTLIPMRVGVGDAVLFAKYGGTEFEYNGNEYIVLSERDLLVIL